MKHWRVALVALALGASSAAIAAPADAPNPGFTGADLFNLSVAADPQISPDGRWIAYVRRSNDVMTDRARTTTSSCAGLRGIGRSSAPSPRRGAAAPPTPYTAASAESSMPSTSAHDRRLEARRVGAACRST